MTVCEVLAASPLLALRSLKLSNDWAWGREYALPVAAMQIVCKAHWFSNLERLELTGVDDSVALDLLRTACPLLSGWRLPTAARLCASRLNMHFVTSKSHTPLG